MKALALMIILGLHFSAHAQKFSNTPNFKELNEKIIIPKCLQCHNDNYAQKNVYLTSYDDVSSYAVPGKADESILYETLTTQAFTRMPVGQKPLDSEEMAYIKAWINGNMAK